MQIRRSCNDGAARPSAFHYQQTHLPLEQLWVNRVNLHSDCLA